MGEGKEKTNMPVRARKKSVEPKVNIILQYGGREINVDDIREAVRKDWEAEHGSSAKSVDLYLKIEDNRCYYVIDETSGSVEM